MNLKKSKIVFMGTPEYAKIVLEGLLENEYNVELVVSQPDKKVGRKQIITPTCVKVLATDNNIETFQPVKIRDDFQKIVDMKPDLIITAAYGQIVPKEVLDCAKFGCINLHGSLLPKYRGGAPIQWAIINGEKKTGVTLMYMDEKMDTGDVICEKEVIIEENDNLKDIFEKMSYCAKDILIENIDDILTGTNSRTPQDNDRATYAWNINKDDEFIDINLKTALEIHNHVRGLYPYIIANFVVDNVKYKIHETRVVENLDVKNYEVCKFLKFNKKVYLPTIDHKFLEIVTIQRIGKKAISGKDFANQI